MAATDFSRDLGYLDKFLQGLRAHAATLGKSDSTRLAALLDEQDRAWTEIRGLLAGTPGAASKPSSEPVSSQAKAPAPAAPPAGSAENSRPPASTGKQLTVGSLMAR